MNVKELIEKLQELPQHMTVRVWDHSKLEDVDITSVEELCDCDDDLPIGHYIQLTWD